MNWMGYKLLYLAISLLFLGIGVFGLLKWGLNLGVDFTGGIIAEYKTESGEIKSFRYQPKSGEEIKTLRQDLKKNGEELRFETVGPAIGPELVKKTIYALSISAMLILLWVSIQFKSFKFGMSAILAMLHDTLILVGSFAIFGHFWEAEIDFLFVTAALTILSFSVHDTIVVFDRIREKMKKEGGDLTEIVNLAITETMTRSLNNSFTIVFMLLSLVLLGGETIKWFAIALLIGTIFGTYSSPFAAAPILVVWDKIQKRFKK